MWSKPKGGMVHFLQTDVGANLHRKIIIKSLLLIPLFLAIFAVILTYAPLAFILFAALLMFICLLALFRLQRGYLKFPLAVNLNHPWVDLEIGEEVARVQIWTEEKGWFDLSENHIKVVKDPLSRTLIILAEDGENTFIGNFPPLIKGHEKTFALWVNYAILTALISNGVLEKDYFSNAREREKLDSGLLEREWGDTTPGTLDDFVEIAAAKR